MQIGSNSILEVKNLTKALNGHDLFSKLSFSLTEGSCLGIRGDNGTGKTTLLNILSRLTDIDQGDIILDGKSYIKTKPWELAKLGIGRSFQQTHNFNSLTIIDNLITVSEDVNRKNGLIHGVFSNKRTKEAEEQVKLKGKQIMKELGVDTSQFYDPQKEPVKSFSLGQQRLIELIRLFMLNPRIYLLDEPTVNLSTSICQNLIKIIRRLLQEGKSFIIISHDLDFLEKIATKSLLLGVTKAEGHKRNITPLLAIQDQTDQIDRELNANTQKPKILELINLCVTYNGREILKSLSLDLYAGEVVTITGENGSGKTTLAKSIFGFCKAEGSIKYKNNVITSLTPTERAKKGISYLFQDKKIFSRMTVEENLQVSFTGNKSAFRERINRIYNEFPALKTKKTQSAGNLSGGEQQMLAFGRILMQSPGLILLDEPFSGLSNAVTDITINVIRKFSLKGISFIIIEHNSLNIEKVSQRSFRLSNGILQ